MTPRTRGGRLMIAIVAGLAGGAALGAVSAAGRGSGQGGLSFWLENVGGLWVAAAFAVGAFSRRRLSGLVSGAVAMVGAVVVYDVYGQVRHGLAIPAEGSAPSPMFHVRPFWLIVGLVVGLVFGALGGWWGEQPVHAWLPAGLAGGVIMGEILALSVGGLPHPMFSSTLALVQAAGGLAGASVLGGREGWWQAAALALAVGGAIGVVELATGLPSRLIW